MLVIRVMKEVTDIAVLKVLKGDQVGPTDDTGELQWYSLFPVEGLACWEDERQVELGFE